MKLSNIYELLSEERKNRGISQKEIADNLNVEQAAVSMYENGKRSIPLDLLDEWIRLMEIEIRIIPKGTEPVRPEEDVRNDLELFQELKKRRNFLIAELRAQTAAQIVQVPEFQNTEEESGEWLFWPYSFTGEECVGLVETRYDHPEQKYMAVEYTDREVNVYKFLSSNEVSDGQSDQQWLSVNRIYFSEDDFLTFSDLWDHESMDLRKITLLRKNESKPDGVEIVATEGFSVRSLLQMQENYIRYDSAVKTAAEQEEYMAMEDELDAIRNELIEICLNNKLGNGSANPEFAFWTEEDKNAIDVPLWSADRNWVWNEEGVAWVEKDRELEEIRLISDSVPHEHLHVHRHEDGNRIIGLVGENHLPAVFKSNHNKPNVMYRVAVKAEDLNHEEQKAYAAVLKSKTDLDEIRRFDMDEERRREIKDRKSAHPKE